MSFLIIFPIYQHLEESKKKIQQKTADGYLNVIHVLKPLRSECMKKAMLFDFDYTLGDSTNGIALSANYALKQLGYNAKNIDEIKKTIGLSLEDTYSVLTSKNKKDEAEQFSFFFKQKADEVMVANTELYSGVSVALKSLQSNRYITGIVTTKFHYRIEQILNKFNASDLIDIIIGAEDVKNKKPDPEGILMAIRQLNLKKSDVLYVGDSLVDAQSAENAGIDFAGVLTGTTTKSDFRKHNSIYIGETVLDICDFIFK